MGGQGNVDELKAGMESAKGFISREMAKKVKLKYTPKLEFFYDSMLLETYEIIDKIDESIERRQQEELILKICQKKILNKILKNKY